MPAELLTAWVAFYEGGGWFDLSTGLTLGVCVLASWVSQPGRRWHLRGRGC